MPSWHEMDKEWFGITDKALPSLDSADDAAMVRSGRIDSGFSWHDTLVYYRLKYCKL